MKHILDRTRAPVGNRFKRYAHLDALTRAAPRKQAQVLRRMPKTRDSGARLRRYLWIARNA